MNVRIEDIVIGKRIRKDPGDLRPLMESMRLHGLMNPVVVNRQNELIAGFRRLESARLLGWNNIEVRVMDAETDLEMLEMEIEENLHRRNLAADELADGYDLLERIKHPSIFRRFWNLLRRFFKALFGKKRTKRKPRL